MISFCLFFFPVETADIPGHVFMRGIIVAVFISVAAVCVVVLCVIYKVDLVLFYRRLLDRDETLTGNML